MIELTATVHARSPRRYLDQLCAHLDAVNGMDRHQRDLSHHGSDHAPPSVIGIEHDDPDHAILEFDTGTCELRAADTTLNVAVRGEESRLGSLAASIAHRLETIGRRDMIAVRWTRRGPES